MNMLRKIITKIGKAMIKCCQPYNYVAVEVSQIYSGNVLSEKNIVVTGGNRGLGLAMAKKFISEGANVIIIGRDEELLVKVENELGEHCKHIKFDVTNIHEMGNLIAQCIKIFGGEIDCLVCNAGISLHESDITYVTIDGFDRQFNTNLRACYFLCQAFIEDKLSKTQSDSNILITSSETGDMCYDIPYGMTKAGLNTLTRALSRRFYSKGVRVNAIAPGVTLSDMTDYAKSDDGNLCRQCAAGRVFLPEEVAEVACFLLSDASKCISGEIIHTNAGNHLRPFWE